ncbi:hypothetical protein RZS08_08825, partial [Arthrospira platensis SPKY1]|nr:hypothetical protein [Arthrospira platensis SPKY1]
MIVAFLLLTASESRSQDDGAACCRADTLIDRFQQRFFGPLVECGCNTKVSEDEFPDEKTSGQKAAPIQKAPMIQKSASCAPKGVAVQKHSAAQRSSCAQRTDCGTKAVCGQTGVFSWTGCGLPHGCEPCGYCRRNLGSGVLDRLQNVRGWLLPTSFCRSSAK